MVVTVVMGLSVFFGSSFGSQQMTAKTGVGAVFLSANIVIYQATIGYFSPEGATNPLIHTWALSVEEQVYLIFPALLLLAWWVGRALVGKAGRRSQRSSRRVVGLMLALVGVPSFVACVLISFAKTSLPTEFAFYWSLTRLWEFAIGAGLALGEPTLGLIRLRHAAVLGLCGAGAILIGSFVITGAVPYPGWAVLVPVAGASAVIVSGFHPKAGMGKILGMRPLVYLGDLSYAWYLWHWPLIVFAAIIWPGERALLALVGVASLIPAWASTTFLENPVRRRGSIKGLRIAALAGVCAIVPTAAAAGLYAGASHSWGNKQVANMQTQVGAEHVSEKKHCSNADASSSDQPGCQYNASSKGPHVYLVGNSVAAMYSEALIGASNSLQIPLTLDTKDGCFSSGQGVTRQCSDAFTATIGDVARHAPGIVVMSSTWDLGMYRKNPTDPSQYSHRQKAQFLIQSLTQAINKLRRNGDEVLIVLPTPRFFHSATPGKYVAAPDIAAARSDVHSTLLWRPEDCSAIVAEGNPANCGATVPAGQEDDAQSMTLNTLEKIAVQTDSTTLDLRSHFCWSGVCRTNEGDVWMFRDGIHISVEESTSLVPDFVHILKPMIRDWTKLRSRRSIPRHPAATGSPGSTLRQAPLRQAPLLRAAPRPSGQVPPRAGTSRTTGRLAGIAHLRLLF